MVVFAREPTSFLFIESVGVEGVGTLPYGCCGKLGTTKSSRSLTMMWRS